MKILILIIFLAILSFAFVGAVSLGVIESDFTEKVLKIDSTKICEMEMLSNVFVKRCDKDTKSEIDINEEVISISKDPKTNVMRVRNE